MMDATPFDDRAARLAARRLLKALDKAAAAQREVEAARAALARAATRPSLRLLKEGRGGS